MTEGETKAEKFSRLATKRTQAALAKIKLIGNLAGSGYECTEEQATKIIQELRRAIDGVEERFQRRLRRRASSDSGFSL